MTLLPSFLNFSVRGRAFGRHRSRNLAPVVAASLVVVPASWAQDAGQTEIDAVAEQVAPQVADEVADQVEDQVTDEIKPEVADPAAPDMAVQSLRLDRLLGDVSTAMPASLTSGPVWTFTPAEGRALVVLPIAVNPAAAGVKLSTPAITLQGGRFVAWVLPEDAASGRRGGRRPEDAGPTDAQLMDLGGLLAKADDDAAKMMDDAAAGDAAGAAGDASDVLPEGAPRAARSLELLAGGRVAWMPERSLPGTIQPAGNPPTPVDAYRLKLDPQRVRDLRPVRPERLARNEGESRRDFDARVRAGTQVFRDQTTAYRGLTEALRELPERFETRRPAVISAVFELNNAAADLVFRGHPAGRWAVSRGDLETLGRLATAGGGQGGRGGSAPPDSGLTPEQTADVATLSRVAADGHPWGQRAAARALAGSGLLTLAGPGDHDAVGAVARRLLKSDDAVARNATVYALTQLPASRGVAELLAAAWSQEGTGDPGVTAAAVRAWLAVEMVGNDAAASDGRRRGAAPDVPAVERAVASANLMLADPAGPDPGVVVRQLLAVTAGTSSGGRGDDAAAAAAALVDGLKLTGLAGARFDAAATAVIESAPRYPGVAGAWLNRQLLGSADRGQVEQTLDLLDQAVRMASAAAAANAKQKAMMTADDGAGEGAAAGPARPGLPLGTPDHALFGLLNAEDAGLRAKAWAALPAFVLPEGRGRRGAAAAETDPAALLDAVLNAALVRATTPAPLVPFLLRQPEADPLGSVVTRALVRVTAQGDTPSARQAAQALLGTDRNVTEAIGALNADDRARFAARLYDRVSGSLSPVTGLIRAEGSTMTRFLAGAMAESRLPDPAEWAEAVGRETTLYGYATDADDGLARGAIAALAALAGGNTPQQLAAVAAFEGRRDGMSAEAVWRSLGRGAAGDFHGTAGRGRGQLPDGDDPARRGRGDGRRRRIGVGPGAGQGPGRDGGQGQGERRDRNVGRGGHRRHRGRVRTGGGGCAGRGRTGGRRRHGAAGVGRAGDHGAR